MKKKRSVGRFDFFIVIIILLMAVVGYLIWHYFIKHPKISIEMADSFPYSSGIDFQIRADKNFYIYETRNINDFKLYEYNGMGWTEIETGSGGYVLCNDVPTGRVEECLAPRGIDLLPRLAAVTEASFYWEGLTISELRDYTCLRGSSRVEEKCAPLKYIGPGRYKIEVMYYTDNDAETGYLLEKEFEVV